MDGSSPGRPGLYITLRESHLSHVLFLPGSGGDTNPVLPIFIQMNTRFVEEDDQWREVSRWVKFQENVEDGGKRWSKPFVPSTPFSVFSDLREQLQSGSVILKSDGKDIQEIVGNYQLLWCIWSIFWVKSQQSWSQRIKYTIFLTKQTKHAKLT